MSRLVEEIEKYKEAFKDKVPADIREIMLKATKNLEDASISAKALKKGSVAKNFTLPNALGESVSLDALLEDNEYLVVNFYRGVWCPYCNLELQALQSMAENFAKVGTKIVAISPQTPDASLTTKEKNELTFEVLSDEKNVISKEYGLVFSLAEELRPIYTKFGIDIPTLNEDDSYELPMPATYLINKNKEVLYSFIDEDYTKRCEPQIILDIIAKK
jgi:peroxiredoxin